jgi:multiple sugar transport system ATP-binding protein
MYDRPDNIFVAGFIGSPAMNLFDLEVGADGTAHLGNFDLSLPRDATTSLNGSGVTVGVRPEDLTLVGADQGIPATVELVEELGSDAFLHASVQGSDGTQVLVARVDPRHPPKKGEDVSLAPKGENVHWFNTATGSRISA